MNFGLMLFLKPRPSDCSLDIGFRQFITQKMLSMSWQGTCFRGVCQGLVETSAKLVRTWDRHILSAKRPTTWSDLPSKDDASAVKYDTDPPHNV